MTNSIVFNDERVENEYDRIYTINNYPELFNEYDTGYINDNICQIADDCTSVYYSDCVKYAMQNPDYMGRVVEEGLIDTKNYDFYQHCSAACWLANETEMHDMFDDLIKFKMLSYCRENGIQITWAEYEKLCDVNFYQKFDEMEDIIDHVKETLQLA